MEAAIEIIGAALRALASIAPAVAAAITGGQSVDEALEAAYNAAHDVPVTKERWSRDDAEQDARIRSEAESRD